MALVGYSDSEGSDSETTSSSLNAPAKSTAASAPKTKPSFQKVVDRANPGKIRVSLPDSKTTNGEEASGDAIDGPPAKRARTAGAFSGFNSLLPAPKSQSKTPASGTTERDVAGTSKRLGLGSRVSLKTGSAPAFSRAAVPAAEEWEKGVDDSVGADDSASRAQEGSLEKETGAGDSQEQVELIGKATMFTPPSVARSAALKKKKPPSGARVNGSTPRLTGDTIPQAMSESALQETTKPVPKAKPKQSLFSSYEEDAVPAEAATGQVGEYNQSEFEAESAAYTQEPIVPYNVQTTESKQAASNEPPSQSGSLQTLANQLNLSESERRQLFGRKGKPTEAQLTQFSLATEYARNNEMIQNQETAPAHNPVRSIQPGKHSLQQLVNAASNQKDALEESFATGRKNKRDAGNRYGWS